LGNNESAGSGATYAEQEISRLNPAVSIDQTGVGWLREIRVHKDGKTRPGIKLGICGEHRSDPDSVKFCHGIGLA
jgi:pyruvate,orthophosphate dikinase